jgi:hypothetical protein
VGVEDLADHAMDCAELGRPVVGGQHLGRAQLGRGNLGRAQLGRRRLGIDPRAASVAVAEDDCAVAVIAVRVSQLFPDCHFRGQRELIKQAGGPRHPGERSLPML